MPSCFIKREAIAPFFIYLQNFFKNYLVGFAYFLFVFFIYIILIEVSILFLFYLFYILFLIFYEILFPIQFQSKIEKNFNFAYLLLLFYK